MSWEDTNKSHIELLIRMDSLTEAHNALRAYIRKNGKDFWAENQLALVEDKLQESQ